MRGSDFPRARIAEGMLLENRGSPNRQLICSSICLSRTQGTAADQILLMLRVSPPAHPKAVTRRVALIIGRGDEGGGMSEEVGAIYI